MCHRQTFMCNNEFSRRTFQPFHQMLLMLPCHTKGKTVFVLDCIIDLLTKPLMIEFSVDRHGLYTLSLISYIFFSTD